MIRTAFLTLVLSATFTAFAWQSARAQEVGYASESIDLLPENYARDFNLPQLGEPADTALSPQEEARLGGEVVAQLYHFEYLLEDAQITEYLTSTGWRLAEASGTQPSRLQFFVVKDNRINAFALPGGYMGFNAGLITASEHESELAGVMAHELAHVTQRHIARSANKSGGLASIATWAAVLAAIIAGSADPNVILAALGIGQTISYQRQVGFTRSHELEADRIGIQTLSDAGFDTVGMAAFFQKLEQQSRLYGTGVPEFLRTHPINTTRIAEARSRAADLPQREVADSIEYELMRARTQVFAANQPSEAVGRFSSLLSSGDDSPGTRYGLAFALSQLGQNQRALDVVQGTIDAHPGQLNLNLLEAALDMGAGNVERALGTYQSVLSRHPRSSAAVLEYAEALIQAGQPAKAREVLLAANPAYGVRHETYRLLSLAARQSGNHAEASYQMATYLFLRGDPGGALAQLDAGLRLKDLDEQERARLVARRTEVREALPKNWNPDLEEQRRRR